MYSSQPAKPRVDSPIIIYGFINCRIVFRMTTCSPGVAHPVCACVARFKGVFLGISGNDQGPLKEGGNRSVGFK